MFLKKRFTINMRYLDHCSMNKTIVNKLIFVIIKKFIFSKALERGGIGRRTALKMRHLRVGRFKSDRSHFDEYLQSIRYIFHERQRLLVMGQNR